MRRGGYNNQASVMHNGPHPHGPHHSGSQNRVVPNRLFHHPQQHSLQGYPSLQAQMVPYGHGPRTLPPYTSPPLPSNPMQPPLGLGFGVGVSHSHSSHNQHPNSNPSILSNYSVSTSSTTPGSGSSGGSGSSHSHSHSSSSAVVGGDMPPMETVVARLETACRLLHGVGGNNTRVNEIGVEIQILAEDLRRVGPLLESAYPDVLDRVMSSMRDASAQPSLPPSLRLAIFELVELRASKWLLPSDSSNYYRQRRNINDAVDEVSPSSTSGASPSGRGASQIQKPEIVFQTDRSPPSPIPSGSTGSDTSSTAKPYREEVVIKNSDSGKVAPTAKERVLSINGYSQQSINMAKHLIQETIQRNASPVFDGSSSVGPPEYLGEGDDLEVVSGCMRKMGVSHTKGEETVPRFCYSVSLGDELIKITGTNLQFVQEAKFTLDDYFSQKYPELFYANVDTEEELEGSEQQSRVSKYDRTTLLSLSLASSIKAPDFNHLDQDVRESIVLEKSRSFDPERFFKETATGLLLSLENPSNS